MVSPGIGVKACPGLLTFELYPDVSGYKNKNLYQTNPDNLDDGRPAKLFSSYHEVGLKTLSVEYEHIGLQ